MGHRDEVGNDGLTYAVSSRRAEMIRQVVESGNSLRRGKRYRSGHGLFLSIGLCRTGEFAYIEGPTGSWLQSAEQLWM